jgi:hypothetical protein
VAARRPSRRVPYADMCPRCMKYDRAPKARLEQGDQMSCVYACPCGNEWFCNWSIEFVEGRTR